MAAIQQDTAQDFYPFFAQPFNTYLPPMTDNSPQAASGSIPLLRTMGGAAGTIATAHASNVSTALWAGALVLAALVIMHIAAEA